MFDLKSGVRLRAFNEPVDLDSILGLYNDVRVASLINEGFVVPRGAKFKEDFKELIKTDAEMFCVIETLPTQEGNDANSEANEGTKNEPEFIGITAFWGHRERGHQHVNFSLVLLPKYWGKGIGKEVTKFMVDHAFLHLNIHRISLELSEGNERAEAVYKKSGFLDEGRQRKAVWVDGDWRDVIHMGLLAEEWRDMNPRGVE